MISVVIPAYNEEKNIDRCLEGLVRQVTNYPFEVILVDNASTDSTVGIARSFLDTLPLRIISEKEKGRGHARATGFRQARGDIILSTDADTVVPPWWIEKMVKPFTDPQIAAVTGKGRMIDSSPVKNTLITYTWPLAMHMYALLHRHYWLTGFNFGIRKNIYERAGGFRHMNGLEDVDLGFRVYKLGKIKYKPIWVYMSGRRFDKGIMRGMSSYLKAYVDYTVRKKDDIYLSDIRE